MMTLGELKEILIQVTSEQGRVADDTEVTVRIDNSDHYASGNYERRDIKRVAREAGKIVIEV